MVLRTLYWCLVLASIMPAIGLANESAICKNIVLITLDGLRTEEVFAGTDARLMVKSIGVDKPEELNAKYWRESAEESREFLLPLI